MTMQDGSPLPAFDVESTSGRIDSATLADRIVVFYFYPRDNTPGCTQESIEFRDLHDDFVAAGATVLGISRDSLKSHERFRDRQQLPFPLIADTGEALCEAFGVMRDKNMYGRKVRGIERSTFVFDRSGRLARSWRKVSVPGHAAAVLDFVRTL